MVICVLFMVVVSVFVVRVGLVLEFVNLGRFGSFNDFCWMVWSVCGVLVGLRMNVV